MMNKLTNVGISLGFGPHDVWLAKQVTVDQRMCDSDVASEFHATDDQFVHSKRRREAKFPFALSSATCNAFVSLELRR